MKQEACSCGGNFVIMDPQPPGPFHPGDRGASCVVHAICDNCFKRKKLLKEK